MSLWHERSPEVAYLLNPAFGAVLLNHAARAYEDELSTGVPFPLMFLILPVLLHGDIRRRLPRSTGTRFHSWITEHPDLRVGFADRVQAINPFSREALMFGLTSAALSLGPEATVIGHPLRKGVRRFKTPEVEACEAQAGFVGRWFGQAGTVQTIFNSWGVQI